MSRPAYLKCGEIYHGQSQDLLKNVEPSSVALSVWSPPYYVGKSYEKDLSYADWRTLLADVIAAHFPILKPGAFLAVNIADILCFADPEIPRFQAETINGNRRSVTREDIVSPSRRVWPGYKNGVGSRWNVASASLPFGSAAIVM